MFLKKFKQFFLSKKGVLLFFFLFLAIQVFEAILWREDFPFSKWGMYYRLPSNKNVLLIQTRIAGQKISLESFKNPWSLERDLRDTINYNEALRAFENGEEPPPKWLNTMTKTQQQKVKSAIANNLKNKAIQKGGQIESFLLGWREFSHETLDSPDWKVQIFKGRVDELK